MLSRPQSVFLSQETSAQLFQAALRRDDTVPPNPRSNPVTTEYIDRIAHAMWEIAMANDRIMDVACKQVTDFHMWTLKTLAKLNFLPTWWLFRMIAKNQAAQAGWKVEDHTMASLWENTMAWVQTPPQQVPISQEAQEILRRNSAVLSAMQQDYGGVSKVDE
jgi:hypothetical protein